MTLSLKKYDVDHLVDDANILLIGKRATGKTILTQYILSQFPDISRGVVFSTSHSEYGYDHQEIEIMNEYDGEKMKKILEEQKERIRRNRKGDSKEDARMFIVLDDQIIYNHRADSALKSLLLNNRRYKILVISILSAPVVPADFRPNFNLVFLFRENVLNQRRMLYENFGGMLEKFEQFNMIFEQCTEDYGCLVIDQTTRESNIDKTMFWFLVDKAFVDTQDTVAEENIQEDGSGGSSSSEENQENCVIC